MCCRCDLPFLVYNMVLCICPKNSSNKTDAALITGGAFNQPGYDLKPKDIKKLIISQENKLNLVIPWVKLAWYS